MLTKSKYVLYCKCPRLYYLNEYHPELASEISEFEQQIMDDGTRIGDLARRYFGPSITIQRDSNKNMAQKTLEALNRGEKIICEASFIYEDLFCAVDILKVNEDHSLEIYEVKSSTHVQTYQEWDASFQYYVLTKLGYNVKDVKLLIVNKNYIFEDKLDLKKYFMQCDINRYTNIESNVKDVYSLKELPERKCNANCKDCPFFNYCYKDLVKPNVFSLAGLRNIPSLINEGIYSYQDYLNSKYSKKTNQTTLRAIEQVNYELNNLPIKVDKDKVNKYLKTIKYPIYYLDFETIRDSVPFINGTNAGFSRVFQYSLHIQETKGAPCKHLEYIQDGHYDNLLEVAERLVSDLGKEGTILTYNMSYESGHIEKLSELVPSLKKELEAIRSRINDLEIPFKKRYIYCKEMMGKSSIKKVLPALVEGFEEAYYDLPYVHNGSEAMAAYNELLEENNPKHEFIKESLLRYCELDTLAMVKILEKIYKLVEE